MIKNNVISAALIDTSAIVNANSDFLGIKSKTLISFFNVLKEKGIALLNHPVLVGEMNKHIDDSSLIKNYNSLVTSIEKCNWMFQENYELYEHLDSFVRGYDLHKKLLDAFLFEYNEAILLDYPNMNNVFDKYFSGLPPFSIDSKKKHEFPDGVVIESLLEYIEENPNERILVVSNDPDWESAFSSCDDVVFVKQIDDALKYVNSINSVLSVEMMNTVFKCVYDDIIKSVKFSSECECFDNTQYEFLEDFEVSKICVESIDDNIVPLKINRNELLFKTTAKLSVAGSGVIFDEDRSIWDREENCYWTMESSYYQLIKGESEVDIEVRVVFDFNDVENSTEIEECKLITNGNIEVRDVKSVINPIYEDSYSLRSHVLKSKDDLTTTEDLYRIILRIMNDLGYISICGCGTHYWGGLVYEEELVSSVISELKKVVCSTETEKEIIIYNIKKIIEEADPTDHACPGCGFPRL